MHVVAAFAHLPREQRGKRFAIARSRIVAGFFVSCQRIGYLPADRAIEVVRDEVLLRGRDDAMSFRDRCRLLRKAVGMDRNQQEHYESAGYESILDSSHSDFGYRRHSRTQIHNEPMHHSSTSSPIKLEYHIVDVFTATPLTGNPLAVVFDAVGLSTELMQAVAREFNLSETTFVQRRAAEVEAREGVRVRIFTTQDELPFAGHPTLGTASVLRQCAPETVHDGIVSLALNVGKIPVRFEPGTAYGEMTQRDPEFGAELDRAEVARLCALALDNLDSGLTPQVVSTGTSFAIVVLSSIEALSRLKVRQDEATAWLREREARWFYVLAPEASPESRPAQQWRARMQFYGGEDPATGSAAGCAISYLVDRGAVQPGERVQLKQGVEIGRSSDLFLSARRDGTRVRDVRVGGSTVPVARGHIYLP